MAYEKDGKHYTDAGQPIYPVEPSNKHIREIKDPYTKLEPPHKGTASSTSIPEPNNELDYILLDFWNERIHENGEPIFANSPALAKAKDQLRAYFLKQVLEGRIDENKQWLDHFFQSVPKADIKSRIKALEAELKKENP